MDSSSHQIDNESILGSADEQKPLGWCKGVFSDSSSSGILSKICVQFVTSPTGHHLLEDLARVSTQCGNCACW